MMLKELTMYMCIVEQPYKQFAQRNHKQLYGMHSIATLFLVCDSALINVLIVVTIMHSLVL